LEKQVLVSENRSRVIDGLRGVSAVAVAMFHFNEQGPALFDSYHRAMKHGWLGVTVFFVLSGFCIAACRGKDAIVPFWAKRLLRIYPAYWASLLVVLAVVGFRIMVSGVNDLTALPRGAGAWAFTFLALSKPASTVLPINWVYWSLAYELAFYLVMGAVFQSRRAWLIIVFSAAALVLSRWGYPFDQWGLFGLGVACFLWTERRYRSAALLAVICLIEIPIALSLTEMAVSLSAALLILFPPTLSFFGIGELFRRTGKFSYSLYLTHVPIGCFLISSLLGSRLDASLGLKIVRDLILLFGCLLFSLLFYRAVEKPTHAFARKFRP
jgi:peptidoglycan/LPS O-acetylase OafA/YrhL